jgi:hypothetical protein
MCLDGAELEFYKYNGELVELLEAVRGNLNEIAETWSKEEKDVCLEETMASFKVSISIQSALQRLFSLSTPRPNQRTKP